MATTDTKVSSLIINVLSQEDYESITPEENQLYLTPGGVAVELTSVTGYDATKTQVLKNVNGTLTWVDEA